MKDKISPVSKGRPKAPYTYAFDELKQIGDTLTIETNNMHKIRQAAVNFQNRNPKIKLQCNKLSDTTIRVIRIK